MESFRNIVRETYREYLSFLKDLVSIKTVCTNPIEVEMGIAYCLNSLQSSLPNWIAYRDEAGNLLYINPKLNVDRPILYLCAHIDTVDAKQNEWVEELDPFTALETDVHIIGRGVNDCKAGVAFILYLAFLIGCKKISPFNISFLVSFKEEGNQGKSSSFYANNLGSIIPISRDETCIAVLENTVSLNQPCELAIYHREPSNFFIELSGTLPEIRKFCNNHIQWKPVVIHPLNYILDKTLATYIENRAGHIATICNNDNYIHELITSAKFDCYAILSGDPTQTSVLQKDIYTILGCTKIRHSVVFNYRGFTEESRIKEALRGLEYIEHSPFKYGSGSDQRIEVSHSSAIKYLCNLANQDLSISFHDNPGRSDASEIWNSLSSNQRQKIIPVTFGPGHRSHVLNGVSRKTHGPNEGFHKQVGALILSYFLMFTSYFDA